MFSPQDVVVKHAGAKVAISSATTTNTTAVGLTGSDYAIGILKFGAIAATQTFTAIKVQVSDDDSTYTTVIDVCDDATFSTGSGQTELAAPSDSTGDNKTIVVALDLRHRPHKYLRWALTSSNTGAADIEFAGFVGIGNKEVPPTGSNSNMLGTVFFK